MLDNILVRVLFTVLLAAGAAWFRPFGWDQITAAAVGIAVAGIFILIEKRCSRLSMQKLAGIALGMLAGLAAAALAGTILRGLGDSDAVKLAQLATMLVLVFLGGCAGAAKGAMLNLGAGVCADTNSKVYYKILDTSVIIDGRIADIAATGFLDGVLVIPQFVLHELQMVADSADGMKRSRGRRGLDVLQKIQKIPNLDVRVVQEDFPGVREVDMKLIELAKLYGCKIVTNDFNLNKVAQVRGVEVLNINELTNSLKPVVLPGEMMRVFILKEGKEATQGVAYLDDGTMVVVDNARRMISKTIDISVTSVLQTTAGKMIFGKYDERAHPPIGAGPERLQRREQTVGEN